MKKLILFLTAFLAISCQDNEILETVSSEEVNQNFQIVTIINGSQILTGKEAITRADEGEIALQFSSEAAYQETLNEIEGKDANAILEKFSNTPFISLQKLAVIADQELEDIAALATDEEDFLQRYAIYEKKYEGKLIRNPYDVEDLQLYVPDGDEMSTFLINSKKNVVIGNNIKTIVINNNIDYAHTILSQSSSENSDVWGSSIKVGSKKTTYRVKYRDTEEIEVHVGCQKKVWVGWKNDNGRDMFYQLDIPLSDMTYYINNSPGGSQYVPVTVKITKCLYIDTNTDHFTRLAGKLKSLPAPQMPRYSISGSLYVWTDLTYDKTPKLEENSYDIVYNTLGLLTCPTLLKSTAYGGNFTIYNPYYN